MIKIALQLYSVRDDCAKDLPEVLKSVAKMGYQGVEFAGYYNTAAKDLRKMLDDLGLKAAGTHIKLDTLLGDEIKNTIEFNQILGNKYLIVPWLEDDRRNSKTAWVSTAKLFNEIAGKLKPANMLVGYHNHHIEFQRMEGQFPWDLFYGTALPEVVMQLDLGNAMHGGLTADGILETLKKYPNRAKTVHLKEFSATKKDALIGEGEVKWNEVLTHCQNKGGTEWYIIEQESYAYPPLECVKRCLQNLKEIIG